MIIAGLTGGIGSGKSAAARRFQHHGIPVVDADKIGHALIESGGRAEAAVIEAFGPAVLECGKIDRSKLGKIVFADPRELARLNAIMHPLLAAEIESQCAAHGRAGAAVCIIDAALLGEGAALETWLDCLILVLAAEATRVARLAEHRGMPERVARERMAAQVDPEQKRKHARWVLDNEGSLAALHAQVDAVVDELLPPDGSS